MQNVHLKVVLNSFQNYLNITLKLNDKDTKVKLADSTNMEPTEHYFTEKPTSELKTKTISSTVRSHNFTFITPSGVFSFGTIDRASLLLAEHAVIKENTTILDLGCGWGFLGIMIKKVFPATNVWMTDTNERALDFAQQNAKRNNIKLTIMKSNLYNTIREQSFDIIITNPPMKAGREICYQIIEQAKHHLNTNGTLQLVAFHKRGGAMLEKKMQEVFGNVETIAKKSGFRVHVSVKEK